MAPTTNHLFSHIRSVNPNPASLLLETPDGRRISYGDMLNMSAQYSNALIKLGVRPGDRVAVQVEKGPEALMLYLGTIRAGGVFLPLNTAYTPAEIDYFVVDAEPTVLVCDPVSADALDAMARKTGASLQTLDAGGRGSMKESADHSDKHFQDVPRKEQDLAAILYTSGTTGRSKGAMLSHGNLVSNALTLVESWRFTADDVLLHALPIFHTHGLFVACHCTMFAGGSMLFMPKFDTATVISLLPQATVMMGVPTFYTRLLASPDFNRGLVHHMRLFTSGSAPLSAEVHRAFCDRTGKAILERYGMTETNMTTSNPYDGERRAGTVGFPLPGIAHRIVNPETGEMLPDGEVGIIEIKGSNVFRGYWRLPDKTAREFRNDGYFITGDMGRIDDKGYYQIVGRQKDLIISGGFNVYPAEVEALLDKLPNVAESAVIGVPHPDFGEGVIAVVVPKADAHIDKNTLMEALSGKLAKFKQPKNIHLIEALPRNTMGKVQKNLLRERFQDEFLMNIPGAT